MNLSDGILWYLVFLFSTVFHEAAHAFTAHKLGDSTAHAIGQVSLNPVPHIKREPFGTVIVPLLSFAAGGWMIGWASTPYNPQWAHNYPKKAAAMAAAGPISNFILLIIAAAIIHLGIAFGIFYQPDTITISGIVSGVSADWTEILAKIISVMFSLNLILFIFNLIPFPPLDGSAIPPMYLSEDVGRKYISFIRNPVFAIAGLFIAWKLFDLIYFRVHLIVINLLYPGSNYN
ncbi:MAG: site-2 protease family protein [Ignavibacteriaceae bacterium]